MLRKLIVSSLIASSCLLASGITVSNKAFASNDNVRHGPVRKIYYIYWYYNGQKKIYQGRYTNMADALRQVSAFPDDLGYKCQIGWYVE